MRNMALNSGGYGGTIHVLHVDDEPDFADLAATFLERERDQLEVETATNATDGLARLNDTTFDCVVSDYDMPEHNGIDFLETVREDYPDLPFILFTGKGSEKVASEAFSAGASDYLQKETGTDQYTVLANRITTLVEKARTQRRQERQLKAIETAYEGIAFFDSEGYCRYANERYGDMYRSPPAELRGTHWEEFYPPEEIPYVYEEILSVVDESGYWHGETTNIATNGETFEADHTVSRIKDGGLVCTVRSLSGQEEVEQRLARYETVVETLDDPVYVCDDEGRFQYINDAFVDLVGYDRERLVGSHPRLIKSQDAVAQAERELGRILSADGPESVTFEVEIQPQDGEPITCEDHMGVLPYDGPRFNGSVGVLRDISERRQREQELIRQNRRLNAQEQELRETKRRLELVLEGTGTGIWEWKIGTGEIEWNNTVEQVLGLEPGSFEGTYEAFAKRIHPDDLAQVEEALDQAIETDELYHVEFRMIHEDGSTVWVECPGVVVEQGTESDLMIGLYRDITERKRREEQLERFASIVSHDLRNPLAVASGNLELARKDCESEFLDKVENAHTRMDSLIETLLTLAREGNNVGETEPVALADIIKNCWENVATAEAALITEINCEIRADRSRLQQLLENLMRNAVEYGGEDVTVTIGRLEDGFYVEDDGPGIPTENRDGVFKAGYSTSEGGTGLGLSIVKQVAEAHDWKIRVTDGSNGGARFEITGVEFAAE